MSYLPVKNQETTIEYKLTITTSCWPDDFHKIDERLEGILGLSFPEFTLERHQEPARRTLRLPFRANQRTTPIPTGTGPMPRPLRRPAE